MERSDSWPVAQAAPDTEAGSGIDIGDLGETLSFLRCFDTIFLVDDSAAMGPYWQDVKALLERITPICAKYDPDGIDLFFLNHRPKNLLANMSFRKSGYRRIGGNTADTVAGVFDRVKPHGKCNMGARLTKLFHWYHGMLKQDEEGAALNLIVITAGAFDDDIKAPLVKSAKSLDEMGVPEHQVGVQLFQIGKPTLEVAQTFEYLDDRLHKEAHTRDIVDTTTWTGKPGSLSTDDLVKVVLGAVVKKLDERSKGMELNSSAPARRFDGDA